MKKFTALDARQLMTDLNFDLTEVVWEGLIDLIKLRAKEDKSSVFYEPFSSIRKELHPRDKEIEVMEKISHLLSEGGFNSIKYEVIDDRTLLKFSW
jgi:hypothetical protein